jgi:hypothetical protein
MISRTRRIRNRREFIKIPSKIKTGGDPLRSTDYCRQITSQDFLRHEFNIRKQNRALRLKTGPETGFLAGQVLSSAICPESRLQTEIRP